MFNLTILLFIKKVDGAWSQWGSWGTCSVSCGGGKRSRARSCSNPTPANGGKECIGALSDLGDCNPQLCPTPAAGVYVQVRYVSTKPNSVINNANCGYNRLKCSMV